MKRDAIDGETLAALDLFMRGVAARFDMAGGVLFGSRARGSHRPDSDIDVAVILRGPPGRFVPAMRGMDDIAFDVLLETGLRLQPFPIWQHQWDHPEFHANPDLLNNITREGVRL